MINRLAWIALFSLIVLIFAGAIVRVTGSGLGCPDWPTCWGCLIPPTSADQIDVEKLDLEKFKRYAARHGIDPDTVTRETILESFDPFHTWVEFINRLATLPLGIATLLLALFSFRAPRARGWIIGLSWVCLFDVIGNAVMGAIVVKSGLKPGIITLHMALAFLLIAFLIAIIWMTRDESQKTNLAPANRKWLMTVSLVFLSCLLIEGLMGSQLREQTDLMTGANVATDRSGWTEVLEATWVYKIHRSFSWSLLITSLLIFTWSRRSGQRFVEPSLIFAMVVGMMIMGLIMAHVAIFQAVQVLHVGLTAILLAVTCHWLLRLSSSGNLSTVEKSPLS